MLLVRYHPALLNTYVTKVLPSLLHYECREFQAKAARHSVLMMIRRRRWRPNAKFDLRAEWHHSIFNA